MRSCLLILLCGLVLPYLVGPVLVWLRPGIKAHRCFVQVSDEAARVRFPPQSFRLISELETLGFSLAGHLVYGDELTKLNSMLSLLVNRESKALALVCHAFVSNRIANQVIEFVAFSTEFEDGSKIETSNTQILGILAELPTRTRFNIPQLRDDVSRLYYIHLHYAAQRLGSQAGLPERGDEIKHFQDFYEKEFSQQESLGYVYFDGTTGRYRYSWPVAILGTWRLLWPVRPILLSSKKRRGRLIAKPPAFQTYERTPKD